MVKFKEIETKYSANSITIKAFRKLSEKLEPASKVNVSSFDHYYLKGKYAIRHREGPTPELTVKAKTSDRNNFVRTEINLKLSPNETKENVAAFANFKGFKHNFTIFKDCAIYFWERHNVVYYIVYDENKVEQARFIEIELNEHYPWESLDEAWAHLQAVESTYRKLGLKPSRRLRRSLQEMFTVD